MSELFKPSPQAVGSFYLCVSCRKAGHCRLGMLREEVQADGRTRTLIKCPSDQAGAPGVAHGGWTASVLDEMLGHLALHAGTFTVTGKLTIEYVKPVPVERELEGFAWTVKRDNGRWQVAGELRLAGTEVVLSRATGLFIERDRTHFQRHQEWLSAQDKKPDSVS